MAKETYQVWHDIGWPQSRLDQLLGGWPPSRFPEDYVHVANVQANGLRQAVELTTDKGNYSERNVIHWENNRGVESFLRLNRDTDEGDVIVDPQGNVYRVEQNGFSKIERKNTRETSRTPRSKNKSQQSVAKRKRDRGIER